MSVSESIILDPTAEASGRTQLDITPYISDRGPDFGDAQIAAYMSDGSYGSTPVDFRVPNRTVTIPLGLFTRTGGSTFDEVRTKLQAKVALWQREGGIVSRENTRVGTVYADVVNASLKLGGSGLQAHGFVDADAVLTLECLPDWYGAEIAGVTDDFSTNTIANYTFDAGSGTLSVSGGQLVPSDTTAKRLYHGVSTFGDGEVTMKYTSPATNLAGDVTGLILKRLDANNYLYGEMTGTGGFDIAKVVSGSATSLSPSSSGTFNRAVSTNYWIRFRIEGNLLTVEHWTSAPSPSGTPTGILTHTLSGANATTFGTGIVGYAGIRIQPGATTARYDDFSIEPNTYVERTVPGVTWTTYGVEGDYPARCRLVVTEADGDDQLGLLWGFRSRNYSSASTAALTYEAENLTPISPAAIATLSGASGGASNNTVQHATLPASWTPVLNTNQSSSYATHIGSYRVWARVYCVTGIAQLRFVWDVGDMTNPVANKPWTFPALSQFYLADLGEIRLDATTGTHRWQGQLQAKGASGAENVSIDRLIFQPLDEASGKLRASSVNLEGLAAPSASDTFNQAAGALTGKTADVGGVWAGAGDADDYAVEATGHTAQRVAVSDADVNTGRYAISGVSAFASQVVQADVKWSAEPASGSAYVGVLARYTDVNNWLMATASIASGAEFLIVRKRVAGTVTTLGTLDVGAAGLSTFYTIKLAVTATGNWYVWTGGPGTTLSEVVLSGQDSVLATGGTLASGKPGIYDAWVSATASTRNYNNFSAWVPIQDAAVFANQTCEIRSDGMYRKDAGGNAYGPVTDVIGDLPRVPPAGLEGRTLQGLVRPTRGDFDVIPDGAIDDIRAQLFYRACWLQMPDDTGS